VHKKGDRVNTRREPIRAHQGRTAAGGNAAKSKEGAATLLTQHREGNRETRRRRPSLRAARRAARRAPRFGFGANTEENTEFAFTAGSEKDSEGQRRRLANLKPWPKGVSGNPGGRPKRQPVSEALASLADQPFPGDKRGRTYAQVAAEEQFLLAASGAKGSTFAFSEIADRIEGKPQQRIDMTHHEDLFAGRTDEELEFFAVHGYWPDDDVEKEKLQ